MILSLRQKFTPAVSKQTALDLVERAAVVFLFVFFAVRMLPRLAQLIQLQMTYPELIVAAAGISAQALLLVVSEMLSVILILARQPAATSGSPSMRRAPLAVFAGDLDALDFSPEGQGRRDHQRSFRLPDNRAE